MLGVQQHVPPTTRSASHQPPTKNLTRGKPRSRSNVIESPPDSTNTTPSPSAAGADLPETKDQDSAAPESEVMGRKEGRSTNENAVDGTSENEGDASKVDEDQADANNEDQDNDTHRGSSPLSELSPAPSNDEDDEATGNETGKDNENDRGAATRSEHSGVTYVLAVLVSDLLVSINHFDFICRASNGATSTTGPQNAQAGSSSSISPPNTARSNYPAQPYVQFPGSAGVHENALAGPSAFQSMHPPPLKRPSEEKFACLLELNNELLRYKSVLSAVSAC